MIEAIGNMLKQVTEWFFDVLFQLMVYLLSFIPNPDFVASTIAAINIIVEKSGYILWLMGFDVGFPIAMTSLLIRFLIRRLPFIG